MRELKVTKMEGTGNDFVVFADFDREIEVSEQAVRALCDRHFGVGADGVIRIAKTDTGRYFMDYRNSDGSLAEMCGNGIRCVARYLYDRGHADEGNLEIETRAGTKAVSITSDGAGGFSEASVDMGPASFERRSIPMAGGAGEAVEEAIEVDGEEVLVTAVSMGNPHAVIWVDDPATVEVSRIGNALEHSPAFPEGVNVEFAKVISEREVSVRVWERGSGETLSCGTGACAVAVAASKAGLTGSHVEVRLPGGSLSVSVGETVRMSGPARQVFESFVDLDSLTAAYSERTTDR